MRSDSNVSSHSSGEVYGRAAAFKGGPVVPFPLDLDVLPGPKPPKHLRAKSATNTNDLKKVSSKPLVLPGAALAQLNQVRRPRNSAAAVTELKATRDVEGSEPGQRAKKPPAIDTTFHSVGRARSPGGGAGSEETSAGARSAPSGAGSTGLPFASGARNGARALVSFPFS